MIIRYSLPPNPQKQFKTDLDSIIFGRSPSADLYIDVDLHPDEYVSHVHARLTCKNNEYWIEDLGSENGTWVKGLKIEKRTQVAPEDNIRLGWTIIEIEKGVAPLDHKLPHVCESDETIVRDLGEEDDEGIPVSKPSVPPTDETGQENGSDETVIREIGTEQSDTIERDVTDPSVSLKFDSDEPDQGSIVKAADANAPPFTVSGPDAKDDTLRQTWTQLKALNDFMQAIDSDTTLDELAQILSEQLHGAIPNIQRGALLMPDKKGCLLLKAHWPAGEPSVSMTWVNHAISRRKAFVWSSSESSDEAACEDTPESALYYDVKSAIYLPLLSAGEAYGVMYVDNYLTCDAFSRTDFELLRAIANHVAMFIKNHIIKSGVHRNEVLRSSLRRQYSPKIVDQILKKHSQLQRGGEQIDPVTILITDVRGFTALSEKMDPGETVRALNEMFDAFVPIITEFDGVVDKYVGDSVLAVFGSPEYDPDQWEKAVNASIKMQQAMRMIGEGRKARRLPIFQVGVGIHSGEVIHGFIGSAERIEFTVIGDTVNRAARFCDGAGPGEVVISKSVYEHVYNLVNVTPKTVVTKHPDREPDLKAYIVKGIKGEDNSTKPENLF